MNTFELSLDLDKSTAIQVVTIRQGDSNGTTVRATVYDHGAAADLSGITSAYVEFALPDGTHYYRGAATVSGNTVTALVDENQAASVPGKACNAYFSLSDGANDYSTASFVVVVLKSALDGMEIPENWDSEIRAAISDALAAAAAAWEAARQPIPDGSVTTTKVADGAITEDKVADGSMTTQKLAPHSVDESRIDGVLLSRITFDLRPMTDAEVDAILQ